MSKLNERHIAYLKEKFGQRFNFDKTECKLYAHDIAAMPSLFKPLVGDCTPEGIIQPESEAELIELVQWAQKNKIPLTPRGKATSGYGGAIPREKGLVIDFYRMNKIVKIDADSLTATAEAGVVWEKLDKELSKRGLTLSLYPTSYPSSTVGGWLAQGGAGIGSYEAGWFRDNVLSASVVLPTGEVREFQGKELDLIADTEGIVGFITQVTFKIQPWQELDVEAIGCPNAYDLQKLIEAFIEAKLPIWSLMFINPRMAELKNRAPLMEHYGHAVEERVLLPAAYIMTLAFRKKDQQEIREKLAAITKLCQAEMLSSRIADHEWKNRFRLMVVKRLGPSLVPAEVVLPLNQLGEVMAEIEQKIDQPLVKEGLVIHQGTDGIPEVVILGFIPGDQRKFSYNFVYGLVLTLLKIAEKHKGRPYSSGMYFTRKAAKVLGVDRLDRIKKFKEEVDPQNIMNPGKVIESGLLGRALSWASLLEPLARPLGNTVVTQVGERPTNGIRGIPADVAWYAYSCSQCGYCIDECDQFYGRGWESQSPRGKWYWLREYMEGKEKWNQFMVDTFLVCTTCELCNLRCSAALPIEPSWMKLRGKLINEDRKMTFPPFEMMAAALQAEGDIWAGYRRDRGAWFPEDLYIKHGPENKSRNVYFAGCTASYVEHDIAMASVRLLDSAGVDFTYLGSKENCCATPMLVAGKWDLFVEIMQKNIQAVKEAGGDTVITSCPACDMMWRQVYPQWAKKLNLEFGIKTRHYSEIVAEKIKKGEFKFAEKANSAQSVTWHDSCHIGRVSGVYEPPRELIKSIPNVKLLEMSHNRQEAHCCGSVLTLIKDHPVAAEIGKMRLEEAIKAGAQKVIALCPCCEFQFRITIQKKNLPLEVVDLARFASSALGYKFPDPNPEVQSQWAVFETMIDLMTPRGFAALMESMWPELIAAMPLSMGKIMRFMGKVPGMLEMMKPLFPFLFPRLLPLILPKLMPVMLVKIGERVPMPDYMREQMPALLPKVMNNLLPHMIGDVVPLVTQPMIEYLKKSNR